MKQEHRKSQVKLVLFIEEGTVTSDISTYNNWSLESLPREAGISPTKRFPSKSKLVKLERLPNRSGMPPVILLPANDLQDHKVANFTTLQVKR